MTIGTKSLLFGAHQFILHPLCVAWAWTKLYGFPLDPRLLVAFLVHDWGYWGRSNMDGDEGKLHPHLGAKIMHRLFDWKRQETNQFFWYGLELTTWEYDKTWYYFTLYHSRSLAKMYDAEPSKLCAADKLAITYVPAWLYIKMTTWTGELKEYMGEAGKNARNSGFANEDEKDDLASGNPYRWYRGVCNYMRRWVEVNA